MSDLTIGQPLVLVVEGDDDKNFFEALARHLGIPGIDVLSANGKDNIRPFIAAVASTPGFRSNARALGVTRDADTDPRAAFQSVRDALAAAGLEAPPAPLEVADGSPCVCVMILPASNRPGELEDLCLAAVSTDPAMPCMEAYFECLRTQLPSQPENLSKARVQTFLASRPKPCPSLGVAALKQHWPWGADAFRDARKFLGDLAARLAP